MDPLCGFVEFTPAPYNGPHHSPVPSRRLHPLRAGNVLGYVPLPYLNTGAGRSSPSNRPELTAPSVSHPRLIKGQRGVGTRASQQGPVRSVRYMHKAHRRQTPLTAFVQPSHAWVVCEPRSARVAQWESTICNCLGGCSCSPGSGSLGIARRYAATQRIKCVAIRGARRHASRWRQSFMLFFIQAIRFLG
jgi:hypothetical protein